MAAKRPPIVATFRLRITIRDGAPEQPVESVPTVESLSEAVTARVQSTYGGVVTVRAERTDK